MSRPWMDSRRIARRVGPLLLGALLALTATAVPALAQSEPVTGAIWTTNSNCSDVNQNQFNAKEDVYLNGGPTNPSKPAQSGLPDGDYYVKVTEPDGTLLGSSPTAVFQVVDGSAVQCYQLWAIVIKASDQTEGYDTSGNNGDEYKVEVSKNPAFPNNESKSDNFKVKEGLVPPPEDESHLLVEKFYDANANGVKDGLEPFITGWKVNIADGFNFDKFTPVDLIVAPDDYTVTEYSAVEPNWFLTTGNNPTNVTVGLNDSQTVRFGNVCTGAGGGLTLGFWSNKNGGKRLSDGGNAILTAVLALNLRKADGSLLGSVNLAAFQKFLTSASATNMANMLSAQLAAMKANVENGNVSGSSLVYAPGALGANGAGFITVDDLMAEANDELGLHGQTTTGGADAAFRAYQEDLKNALDNANNNLNFAQSEPCEFSFE